MLAQRRHQHGAAQRNEQQYRDGAEAHPKTGTSGVKHFIHVPTLGGATLRGTRRAKAVGYTGRVAMLTMRGARTMRHARRGNHVPKQGETVFEGMTSISISAARAKLPELIARARREAIFVERHGKTEAVIVSPEQYDRMMDALEEAEDARTFDEAMADEGENIPWAQAKADLGRE